MSSKRVSGERARPLAKRDLAVMALSTAALLSAAACGGADASGGGAPATDAPDAVATNTGPPDAGSSSPDAMAQPLSLSIRGLTHGPDGSVLPGVRVCLERGTGVMSDPVVCALSAADGSFDLSGADANSSATLTFRKDGFTPTLRALMTKNADITLPADENALFPDPLTFMGSAADPSKGQIAFSAASLGGNAEPVSVRATVLDFLTGSGSSSITPVYLDRSGAPAPGASSGTAGGFVNVPPGVYLLEFAYGTASCVPTSGIYSDPSMAASAGSTPGLTAIAVPVRAGYVTSPVGLFCVAKPGNSG
jgi:hypothetical protein